MAASDVNQPTEIAGESALEPFLLVEDAVPRRGLQRLLLNPVLLIHAFYWLPAG